MKTNSNTNPLSVSAINQVATAEKQIHSRILQPQWVLICGSILLLVFSQFIRADVPHEYTVLPLVMLPIGLALFYLGIWTVEKNHLPGWLDKFVQKLANSLGVQPGQVFCLFFALTFAVLTPVAAGFMDHMFSLEPAVICWGLGIFLAVIGASDLQVQRQKVSYTVLLIGVILFAAALALRAYNTQYIPKVLSGDEASSGLFSINFLNGTLDNIFIMGWFSFPALHNFLQAVSISVFGQTTQALRLLSAFAGALTVALVFFVGRSMYGTTTGLAAGILLAGMHFHNHFSRIGLNNIWDGLFLILVLGFLWIGWQKKNRAAYLVAGVSLGLSQYFYSSSHLLFLIIPLWLLAAGLKDRARFKGALPSLLLMFWAALMVVIPLIWYYINRSYDLMAPLNRVGLTPDWLRINSLDTGQSPIIILLRQMWLGALAYMGTPLLAWYMPGVPILRTVQGVIFLLGLMFMAIRPGDNRNQMIFIWLVVFAISGGLSNGTPAAQRYVAAAPAVALMVAYSLQRISDLIMRSVPTRKRLIQIAMIIVALALAADDVRFYYKVYASNNDFSGFNGMVAQKLADHLKTEPRGQEVIFCGYPNMGYDSIASLPYLAPQIVFYNANEPWDSPNTPVPVGNRVLFVFLPDHAADQTAMESEYPGGKWSEFFNDNEETLFYLYEYDRY